MVSAVLTMKRSRKLSRSGWRDRQKIFINSLPEKSRKCIELSGDYIEKSIVCNISMLLSGRVAELFERPS